MPQRSHTFARRRLIAGSAALGIGAVLPASSSSAREPQTGRQAPAFYRFRLGNAELTLVSDGPVVSGDPKVTFRGASREEIEGILQSSFLPTDKLVLEQNILVLNTGDRLVVFDTGMGTSKAFGPNAGNFLRNLAAAGINPASVNAVVLSHAHADHVSGLMAADGSRVFPNAQLYIEQTDYEFWTSPEKTGPARKVLLDHAVRNLIPNRDRVVFIRDGQEFLPGIQAMLTPGHSPGHMIFMITSGGQTLSYIADVGRHHILNVETPRWKFIGDTDPRLGVESRIRAFDMLAADRVPVVSYHYPWPGLGHLAKWGDRYRYIPAAMAMSG